MYKDEFYIEKYLCGIVAEFMQTIVLMGILIDCIKK